MTETATKPNTDAEQRDREILAKITTALSEPAQLEDLERTDTRRRPRRRKLRNSLGRDSHRAAGRAYL